MTITLTFGTWLFPFIVTLFLVTLTSICAWEERNDCGLLSGMFTALCIAVSIIFIPIVWITWAIAHYYK